MSAFEDLDLQQRMLLTFEVEQFLYREAALLDEHRLEDWLGALHRRHSLLDADPPHDAVEGPRQRVH